MTPIRVGVLGAAGRMGSEVCRAVGADAALELVAAVDPNPDGGVINGRAISVHIDAFKVAGADVAVDFTRADSAKENMLWCAENDVHAVVGTTGFSDSDIQDFEKLFAQAKANCIVAPNFAIGAVLMMRFAEMAAPLFETAEIIELHHDAKADAPSGTAQLTAERMAIASSDWASDPTSNVVLEGARGGVGPAGLHIHSIRLRGLVAHQEVLLGTAGQTLSLRHDSYDRTSFMPGVILAVKAVADRPGLTYGIDSLLGL